MSDLHNELAAPSQRPLCLVSRDYFPLRAFAFTPDGARLILGGKETLHWNIPGRRPGAGLPQTGKAIRDLALAKETARLALIYEDDPETIILREAATGTLQQTIRLDSLGDVQQVLFLPGGNQVLVEQHGRGLIVDCRQGTPVRTVYPLARSYSPDGRGRPRFAVAGDGRTAAVWLAYDRCGDNDIRLLDLASGQRSGTLVGHEDFVTCAAFAPGGRMLASASSDGEVRLWDPATARELRRWQVHEGVPLALAFAPNGRILASAGIAGLISLWDPALGQRGRALRVDAPIAQLAFSPDGQLLAAAAAGGESFFLWDLRGGYNDLEAVEEVRLEQPHSSEYSATLTPIGDLLQQGHYRQALAQAEGALAQVDKAGSIGAPVLVDLAQALIALERPSEAIPHLERALALSEQNQGADHPETARVRLLLAGAWEATNQDERALGMFERVIADVRHHLGQGHPLLTEALSWLALCRLKCGAVQEAEKLLRQAVILAVRGDQPVLYARCLRTLSLVAEKQGRQDTALTLRQQVLEILERTLGPQHPEVASALITLATVDSAQSEPLLRRALAIRQREFDPEESGTASLRQRLAQMRRGN